MIWPPLKAWTSKVAIDGHVHFVAINYGGQLPDRWVYMMSVLDSSVVVEVSWVQLVGLSNWECGWDEKNYSNFSKLVDNKGEIRTTYCTHASIDSGLTMPITEDTIRPWFPNI